MESATAKMIKDCQECGVTICLNDKDDWPICHECYSDLNSDGTDYSNSEEYEDNRWK